MDGIFVAYHNAFEIFGFQYISRTEMDERLYGNSVTGDAAFNLILQVYNEILKTITPLYPPEHIVRLTFAPDKLGARLAIFAEDLGHEMPVNVQTKGKNIRQFNLSLVSTVNGFRMDQILLDPNGKDEWNVSYQLTDVGEVRPLEYDSARSRATMVRNTDVDDAPRDSPFMRLINRQGAQAASKTEHLDQSPIIAPWTLL